VYGGEWGILDELICTINKSIHETQTQAKTQKKHILCGELTFVDVICNVEMVEDNREGVDESGDVEFVEGVIVVIVVVED